MLVLAIASVLLISMGCIGGEEEKIDDVPTTTSNQTTPPTQTQDSEPDDQPATLDYNSMEYAALQTLGVPIKCVMENDEMVSELYFKGEKAYMLHTLKSAQYETEVVVKDNKAYIKFDDTIKQGFGAVDCDWVVLSQEDEAVSEYEDFGNMAEIDETDFQMNFNCALDVFGDEKFETSGNICEFEELFGGFVVEDPCQIYTDPADKARCYKQLEQGMQ